MLHVFDACTNEQLTSLLHVYLHVQVPTNSGDDTYKHLQRVYLHSPALPNKNLPGFQKQSGFETTWLSDNKIHY